MKVGNATNTIARLEPYNTDRKPVINVPHTDPMALMETIHESSFLFSGPVLRGVLFESKIGSAGETQPDTHPWLNIMILA